MPLSDETLNAEQAAVRAHDNLALLYGGGPRRRPIDPHAPLVELVPVILVGPKRAPEETR